MQSLPCAFHKYLWQGVIIGGVSLILGAGYTLATASKINPNSPCLADPNVQHEITSKGEVICMGEVPVPS
ncbi:MAG TPA: hypothetical protein VI451_09435, partial [Anaerolineales bacterium]|nr:hypothetical protein [Anaerolineales bacterium]